MKNAIKIAFAAAVATVGIAACATTSGASRNAAVVTPEELPAPTSSASASTPLTVVTEVTTVTVTNPPAPEAFANVETELQVPEAGQGRRTDRHEVGESWQRLLAGR